MNQINPNFDWVTARDKCSASEVYKILEAQVETDVKKRNDLRTREEMQCELEFSIKILVKLFRVEVFRKTHRVLNQCAYAEFSQTLDGIKVEYKDRDPIVGVLTLSNDGECRLKVKDVEEYAFWQFRKLALEPILFGSYLRD